MGSDSGTGGEAEDAKRNVPKRNAGTEKPGRTIIERIRSGRDSGESQGVSVSAGRNQTDGRTSDDDQQYHEAIVSGDSGEV